MTQRSYELQFTHEQLANILQNMLKIPKTHKPLHPSQQRSKYASLFDWLVTAMTSLLKQKQINPRQLAQQQQQLITTSLTQMIDLTRKQCLEKSMVLEMILEYLLSTLNAYWKVFQNASKEISYQYQHNAVKIEKEYISEIKRLQLENQELKKDKEHRWRNMFMLIKDNRVYRKKNKKLMKTIHYQLQKGRLMTEQMITQQFQNEKIKAKLDYLQQQTFNLENYLEMTIKLVQLQKKVKKYPSRCKKMLKNDLINIEINQIKNLHDKINFIIKAVEETGEIIDEIYDEDIGCSNFHYNISTQTETHTEEKATNTTVIRFANSQTQTYNRQHSVLTHCETLQLKVRGLKAEKKDTNNRQSKNVVFISSLSRFTQQKKEQSLKSRNVSKRGDNIQHFSICLAIKITIFQARISYISTYNTQIFNGIELAKLIDQKEFKQLKFEVPKGIEAEIQTDPMIASESSNSGICGTSRSMNRNQQKVNITQAVLQQNKRLLALRLQHFQVCKEVLFSYDPNRHNRLKEKEEIKMKIVQNNEKQNAFFKQITSENFIDTEVREIHSQKFDKPSIKESPMSSKVNIRKTSKNQQWKRSKIHQDEEKLQLANLRQVSKYDSIAIQTQNKLAAKSVETFPKQSQSSVYSKKTTNKPTQPMNSEISEVTSPIGSRTPKKQMKIKQFNKSLSSLNSSKIQTPKQSRNNSSIFSLKQLKNLQSFRSSKLKQSEHKRTVTDANELLQRHQQSKLIKTSQAFKGKPLHRISEDIRQVEYLGDQRRLQTRNRSKDKGLMPLPFFVNKEGDFVLKDMDFSKGLEKILKNMDMRRQQILNNQHTLKSYLISYFKCLYGRQLYQNFINFLINTSEQANQELTICFNKLTNSKLPQPYLVDLFKTFIIMLNKCYLINESITSPRIRLELLISMVNLYYEEEESKRFVAKMSRHNIHNFSGWFICLQDELRIKVIYSELYHFLSEIMIECQDSITYPFIEELTYFIPNEQVQFKNLIRSKTLLGKRTAIHRFALFCLRYQWRKMLFIQQTIQNEYLKVLGLFSYAKSLYNIQSNLTILSQFKSLYKCMRYWLSLKDKYGSQVNNHFMMLCQLVIMEYRMKVDFPISKELRFINLACQGLQKKLFHKELREGLEEHEGGRNYSLY